MRIPIHLMRDASDAGRLVGGTHVWGFDTDANGPFASYEELPHTIDVYAKRFSNARFAAFAASLDELVEHTVRWAETMNTNDPDDAERVTRFLRSPGSYFALSLDETPSALRYTFSVPNLRADQLRGLRIGEGSAQRSARTIIPPYSILEPWSGDTVRRREHRVISKLDAQAIAQLPHSAWDIEVVNWMRRVVEETDRDALLKRMERDAAQAGIAFEPRHYETMDLGLLRKHANELANRNRNEEVYDITVRLPDGTYVSITSLPAPHPTMAMPFGTARIIHRPDQAGIFDAFTTVKKAHPGAWDAGHNQISYDSSKLPELGASIPIGADGESVKTRFAVPGSTIEKRILPDGRVVQEPHHAFLSDRGWRGIDAIDPHPWFKYVDELINTKLATVTRALTGLDVTKSLDHDELENIVQTIRRVETEPQSAEAILREAGLSSSSLDTIIDEERRYALSDVWMSALNAERIAPTLARIALAFEATLSEICTTSPEAHAARAWDPRGETTRRPIRDPRYEGIENRHRFSAEKAFERLTETTRLDGAHDVILARRTTGRIAAEAIDHPVLASLISAYDEARGFDRSWIMRSIDALLTEPLYALLAATNENERDANAWLLGLERRHLDDLEAVIATIPPMRTVASSTKHLYFATSEADRVAALAGDGWIEPLEEGHAIVFGRSVIYRGSRTMASGYADPQSKRGMRNAFTARWLPQIVEKTLDQDYEGALRTIREAYRAFGPDDAIVEKTLGKDADDYAGSNLILDEAERIDARKGDVVFVRMPDYRASLFGFGSGRGLFVDPLFAALGSRSDPGFVFGYTRFVNGADDALRTLLTPTRAEPLLNL